MLENGLGWRSTSDSERRLNYLSTYESVGTGHRPAFLVRNLAYTTSLLTQYKARAPARSFFFIKGIEGAQAEKAVASTFCIVIT
jgi:hypothetical protein